MGAQAEGRGLVQAEGACRPNPGMYLQWKGRQSLLEERRKAGVAARDAENVCGLLPSPSPRAAGQSELQGRT